MSISSKRLTDTPVEGRQVYEIEHSNSAYEGDPNPDKITVDVGDGGYNVEWESDIELDEFIELLEEDLDVLGERSEIMAYVSPEGEEAEMLDTGYLGLLERPSLGEECGNFQVQNGPYRVFWEDMKEGNIIEITSDSYDTDLFQDLYEETSSDRLSAELTSEELKSILKYECKYSDS